MCVGIWVLYVYDDCKLSFEGRGDINNFQKMERFRSNDSDSYSLPIQGRDVRSWRYNNRRQLKGHQPRRKLRRTRSSVIYNTKATLSGDKKNYLIGVDHCGNFLAFADNIYDTKTIYSHSQIRRLVSEKSVYHSVLSSPVFAKITQFHPTVISPSLLPLVSRMCSSGLIKTAKIFETLSSDLWKD